MDPVVVVHLRMSGQLLWVADPAAVAVAPHTHLVASMGGGELRFVDPRTFGECSSPDDVDERGVPAELAHLGRDPLLEGLPAAWLAGVVAGRTASLKALLTDQRARRRDREPLRGRERCSRPRCGPTARAGRSTGPRSPDWPQRRGPCCGRPSA